MPSMHATAVSTPGSAAPAGRCQSLLFRVARARARWRRRGGGRRWLKGGFPSRCWKWWSLGWCRYVRMHARRLFPRADFAASVERWAGGRRHAWRRRTRHRVARGRWIHAGKRLLPVRRRRPWCRGEEGPCLDGVRVSDLRGCSNGGLEVGGRRGGGGPWGRRRCRWLFRCARLNGRHVGSVEGEQRGSDTVASNMCFRRTAPTWRGRRRERWSEFVPERRSAVVARRWEGMPHRERHARGGEEPGAQRAAGPGRTAPCHARIGVGELRFAALRPSRQLERVRHWARGGRGR